VREELDLPEDAKVSNIDFHKIRLADMGKKKRIVGWSGQDVLGDLIDEHKSKWIIDQLNEVRVWPQGPYGYFKRTRNCMKRIVRHAIFENFMTFCVLVNTVTLGLDRYKIPENQN